MRTFNPITGFTLEGNEEDFVPTGDELDTLEGDGVDKALTDLATDEAAVDQNQGVQDQVENSIVALESLMETAQTSLETGGLDPVAAELLTKAVENETAPLGTAASEVVPALEGYSSQSSRKQQTVMAIEGIGETIQKYWAKLKEYIQKGRDAMKKFFISAKQAIVGLDRRIKSLKAAAGKVNFSMPKKTSLDYSGPFAVSASDLTATKTLLATYLSGEMAKAAVSGAEATASALGQGWGEGAVPAAGKAKGRNSSAPKGGGQLVGGWKLVSGEGGVKLTQGEGSKGGNSKLLSQSEVTSLLSELEAIAKMAIDYEKNFQAADRAKEALVKAGDSLEGKLKKEGGGDDAEAGAKVRAALNASNDVLYSLDHPAKELLSYVSKLLSGVGQYVTANLKAYDKGAAA